MVAFKKFMSDLPAELEVYQMMLKRADLANNRAEGRAVSNSVRVNLAKQAEVGYGKALEFITEMVEGNPGLGVYLDRAVVDDLDHTDEGVPRARSSKSRHNFDPI